MAADVGSFVGGGTNESATSEKSTVVMITRDLLGGCCTVDSKELQVPCGWEKRLDLKSGKVYIQRRILSNTSYSSNSDNHTHNIKSMSKLSQYHNFPSLTRSNLFDDDSLELKLVSSSPSTSPSSANYQSVCTLDKVKSALERAEKRKRSKSSMSTKSSSSSSSVRDSDADMDDEEKSPASFAAGCPNCLLYVLITSSNLKCPQCNCNVPLPGAIKKPRIDLNISLSKG